MLFTFPSRYWFTIGGQEYSRLGGWSPQLPTGFLVPRGTQGRAPACPMKVFATGLSPAPVGLPRPFAYPHPPRGVILRRLNTPYNPSAHGLTTASLVWAPARFARHYYGPLHPQNSRPVSGNHSCERLLLILLPRVLRCFSSPGAPQRSFPAGLVPSRTRGCPIRNRWAHRLHAAPPPRFAALRVLLRLLAPRHPPCTFSRLAFSSFKSSAPTYAILMNTQHFHTARLLTRQM